MNYSRPIASLALTVVAACLTLSLQAADKKEKAKAYPLTTCAVSDEKLDTDPSMKAHVFVHEGQEVKLCCKSCLKDFKKDTSTYMKKIEQASKSKK